MKKRNLKKLVRDRVINQLVKEETQFSARGCRDEYEAVKLLAEKLVEESKEVLVEVTASEGGSISAHRDFVKGELADVFEVFTTLMKHYKINATQLEEQCNKKRAQAGGFNDMIYLEWVEDKELTK